MTLIKSANLRRSVSIVISAAAIAAALLSLTGCQAHDQEEIPTEDQAYDHEREENVGFPEDDLELDFLQPGELKQYGCNQASSSQIRYINEGNKKRDAFLKRCDSETKSSPWCRQLIRPNPSSRSTFTCTYGGSQPHQLIHPDESTWKHAIGAIHLIDHLSGLGIKVCQVYNWWRPEPYNRNVGGAAGRHPHGTSVDVRFCSKDDKKKAFRELCRLRRSGRIRAIGYYSSAALHFGTGDRVANTWGEKCR